MRPVLAAQVAVTTATAALLSSVATRQIAQQSLDPRTGLALHAILVTVALLLASWIAVRPRLLDATRAQLRLNAVSGLALGYALTPTTWQGRTYAAQLLTSPGLTAALLDLALWLLVGAGAVLVTSAPASTRERASYAAR